MIVACLAVPWIDERFVLGLPLALACRFLVRSGAGESMWTFFRRECTVPLLLVALYVPLRFWLSGRSGSSTLGGYFSAVEFLHLSFGRILFGVWEGLRVGWIPVIAGLWTIFRTRQVLLATLFAGLLCVSLIAGLSTANDLSRSMVTLLPMVPLGWILFRRHCPEFNLNAAWLLAVCALLLPAHHVVSNLFIPIDTLWNELRRIENPPPAFASASYLQRANALSLPVDRVEIDRCISVAVKLSPRNAETLNQAAVVLASKGQLKVSLELLNKAVQLSPANPSIRKIRSQVNAALGNQQAAEIDALTAKSLEK